MGKHRVERNVRDRLREGRHSLYCTVAEREKKWTGRPQHVYLDVENWPAEKNGETSIFLHEFIVREYVLQTSQITYI